jgi:predicted alpha-1,6-mannanase (GH76 family)
MTGSAAVGAMVAIVLVSGTLGGAPLRAEQPTGATGLALSRSTGAACAVSQLSARRAVGDLVRNFWTGSTRSGHIVSTWRGYPGTTQPLPDPRGSFWERAMLYNALYSDYRTSQSRASKQRLQADWAYVKRSFGERDFAACGKGSKANFAVDDTGWNALYFLQAHSVTRDPQTIALARTAIDCALGRWADPSSPGGLWYSDDRRAKALYQVTLAHALLALHDIAGDPIDLTRAMQLYDWIEASLLRDDGLYWVERGPDGPIGARTPNEIRPTSSVTFLGGNMAMAVLHAKLFRRTGDSRYRQRAIRTADAIAKSQVAPGRILTNDRDAWVNGYFFTDWAEWVTPLHEPSRALLQATADSIARNSRTTEGYYGGDWGGADSAGRFAWADRGSKPQQIMTSASSANVVIATAACQR